VYFWTASGLFCDTTTFIKTKTSCIVSHIQIPAVAASPHPVAAGLNLWEGVYACVCVHGMCGACVKDY